MNNASFGGQSVQISIQTKLSVLMIITATLIFSGFAVFNYVTISSSMRAELDRLTNFLTKQLSESLKIPLWDLNDESVKGIINSTMTEKQVHTVVVRGNNGNVLYGMTRDDRWNIVEIGQNVPENLDKENYHKRENIIIWNNMVGSVEVSVSPVFMKKKVRDETVRVFITVIILNIALICSLFIGVKISIVLPLRRIVGSVRIIASGELDTTVRNEGNDEIGQLASDVDKMRLAIKEMRENLKDQERLKSEIELAKKIQTVLLPKNPAISGYEIAASMNPSEEVGGDYYDVISVGDIDWIVIGDVSGHGVTAGLVMMMVQTSIYTVLIQNPQTQPSRLLSVINRTIYRNIVLMDEQKHMTILVIACGKDGFFDFSGLHENILLWCAETRKVEIIETDGMWIGLEPDISSLLPVNDFRLGCGDCIVLYTDGITEARGKDGNIFGEDRLIRIVESSGGKSAAEIHNAIIDALKDYETLDDVTLFVMKRINP